MERRARDAPRCVLRLHQILGARAASRRPCPGASAPQAPACQQGSEVSGPPATRSASSAVRRTPTVSGSCAQPTLVPSQQHPQLGAGGSLDAVWRFAELAVPHDRNSGESDQAQPESAASDAVAAVHRQAQLFDRMLLSPPRSGREEARELSLAISERLFHC